MDGDLMEGAFRALKWAALVAALALLGIGFAAGRCL